MTRAGGRWRVRRRTNRLLSADGGGRELFGETLRELFEEAAGVGLYRDRRRSAERRFEETTLDLELTVRENLLVFARYFDRLVGFGRWMREDVADSAGHVAR